MEKRYKSTVVSVDFRPKTHGWKRYATKMCFGNGRVYNRLGVEDEYLRSFLYGKYTVRDYCLECKFSNCHTSDITIADFWLHSKLSSLENEDGISLILCNSNKGKMAIESIGDVMEFSDLDVTAASYNNKETKTSENGAKKHEDFLTLCKEKGLRVASYKFIPLPLTQKIKYRISSLIHRRRKK